ncbi:MAG: questin oxidase family protein [Candidatus Dormibacteria bacterium]
MYQADALDESLECFADRGPEFDGGLSNHGPMVVDALVRLGKGPAALPWAVEYRQRLAEAPTSRWPIDGNGWPEALGDMHRAGDWVAFFEHQLTDSDYHQVAGLWAPRLLPGLMAAATHGAIRTFHAVRSLGEHSSELRIHELARALGYWAASYRPLPGDPRPLGRSAVQSAAMRLSAMAPKSLAPGRITDRMQCLGETPEFASIVAEIAPASDIEVGFSVLTEIGARAYLSNASHAAIALVHAVTAPAAVRGLLPLLTPPEQHLALAYAWQAVAGLIATHAPAGVPREVVAPLPQKRDVIINQAVASGDAHAIKLTEAALREDGLISRPAYLLAAADAVVRLARD